MDETGAAAEVVEITEKEDAEEHTEESQDVDFTDTSEISADELGIDLNSLVLPEKTVLGKAKSSSTLGSIDDEPRSVGRPKTEELSLFNWCEKFDYAPGVDYLEVYRLHPKIWEGIQISGFVETLYEPTDEESIAERWGGGSFQFKAHQRDATGRNRIVDQKIIEISGVPQAYRGLDGERRQFFGGKAPSARSDDVLRRRMGLTRFRDRDADAEADDREHRNIDRPLLDASSLYKVQQGAKQAESDALNVLREAQKDAATQMQQTASRQEQMYQTMLTQQKEEIRRVREEAKEQGAPFRDMVQLLLTKGDDGASRAQLEELRRMHDKSLSSLREASEARISTLQDEMNRQRMEYASQVERARNDYLHKEQASKEEAFRQYQAQLESIRVQHGEIREHHRDEVSALRTEMMNLRAEFQQRETALRDEHRGVVDKLQRSLDKAELSARQDRSEYESKIRSEYQEKFNERERFIREHYENKLDSIREQQSAKESIFNERQTIAQQHSQQERETQKLLIESASATREAVSQAYIQRLEAQIKDSQATIRRLEKQLESSDVSGDPFAQLEKLNAIKDKLREHGFVTDDDDREEKEEAPKDFLGKVAHYGPQILGPILQRVDQATAIAQQAVQQQQRPPQQQRLLEHQRSREESAQIAAERQQAAEMAQLHEAELQRRRETILRRRAEREAQRLAASREAEVEDQQEIQPQTEETYTSPETVEVLGEQSDDGIDQPIQEESVVAISERDQAFKRLAEFIAEGVRNKAASSSLVGKLKMAEMMGMFSKDDRLTVVLTPFDELHADLVRFEPTLRSPKARKLAYAVYRGLQP